MTGPAQATAAPKGRVRVRSRVARPNPSSGRRPSGRNRSSRPANEVDTTGFDRAQWSRPAAGTSMPSIRRPATDLPGARDAVADVLRADTQAATSEPALDLSPGRDGRAATNIMPSALDLSRIEVNAGPLPPLSVETDIRLDPAAERPTRSDPASEIENRGVSVAADTDPQRQRPPLGGSVAAPPAAEAAPSITAARLPGSRPAVLSPALQALGPSDGPASDKVQAPAAPSSGALPKTLPAAGAPAVKLLMPAPASGPTPADLAAQRQVRRSRAVTARAQQDLPTPDKSVKATRVEVKRPAEEQQARGQGRLLKDLGGVHTQSPKLDELCTTLRKSLAPAKGSKAKPAKDPLREAQHSAAGIKSSVKQQAQDIGKTYAPLKPGKGVAPAKDERPATPGLKRLPPAKAAPETPASHAVPAPLPVAQLDLGRDVAATDESLRGADLGSPAARALAVGPIAEARDAQQKLKGLAVTGRDQTRAEEQKARKAAAQGMLGLQHGTLAGLTRQRAQATAGLLDQQAKMVSRETDIRKVRAKTKASRIFTTARTQVNKILNGLPKLAEQLWKRGLAKLDNQYYDKLLAVQARLKRRYEGLRGVWNEYVADTWGDQPKWVLQDRERAAKRYVDGVCNLLRSVAARVSVEIMQCHILIQAADLQIQGVFNGLDKDLSDWAEEQKKGFRGRLVSLQGRVGKAQQQFNRELAQRATTAVAEVRSHLDGFRKEAVGLISRVRAAVAQCSRDWTRCIINGLLRLASIPIAAFWKLVARIKTVFRHIARDPRGFASNLLAAFKQGFKGFFARFGKHVAGAFFTWLFSKLGAQRVTIPKDQSPPSLITFLLQLLGITWEKIKELLTRLVGPRNAALIERARALLTMLIQKGASGMYALVKDRLDPKTIIEQIKQAAIKLLVDSLIAKAIAKVLSLFNPFSAIWEAVKLVYNILKWIFENAARIFSLVDTVVKGAISLIAGNVKDMALKIESALAQMIVPVIDFIARILDLGGLPGKIAAGLQRFQKWVWGLVEKAMTVLINRARSLLGRRGARGATGRRGKSDNELGKTVRFSAGREQHRLWVKRERRGATLYVASNEPKPIKARLEEWSGRVKDLPVSDSTGGRPPQQEARSLITQAGMLLRTADAEADALAAKWIAPASTAGSAKGASTPENPSDDKLEAQEDELAKKLDRLFELFGDTKDIHVLVRSYINKPLDDFKKGIKDKNGLHIYYLVTTKDQIRRQAGKRKIAPKLRAASLGQAALGAATASGPKRVFRPSKQRVDYWNIGHRTYRNGRFGAAWLGASTGGETAPAARVARGLDQNGHLIGSQFGGSNGKENLSPMQRTLNHPVFSGFENALKKAMVKERIRGAMVVKATGEWTGAENEKQWRKMMTDQCSDIEKMRQGKDGAPCDSSNASDYLKTRPRSFAVGILGLQEVVKTEDGKVRFPLLPGKKLGPWHMSNELYDDRGKFGFDGKSEAAKVAGELERARKELDDESNKA